MDVLRVGPLPDASVLVAHTPLRCGIAASRQPTSRPGSYWGESEAGLRANVLYVRADTPLHSLLHELSHFVCMSPERRAGLDRDAGGDDAEECAVCYLQILLADELPQLGRERMFADMDAWGYTFRLGNSRVWFEHDAADARTWLSESGLIEENYRPTFRLKAA